MKSKTYPSIFVVIYDNRVIARCKSMRKMAEELPIGKSHIWYSRQFAKADHFAFNFQNETYYFQKI